MDVGVNGWRGTRDYCSDDSNYASEVAGWKAGLQVKVEAGHFPPSSFNYCSAGPSSWQGFPVALHCEAEETGRMHCKCTEATTADIFVTSSPNFDLQCKDQDPELCSLGLNKRPPRRAGDLKDISVTDREDFSPASEVVLSSLCKKCRESFRYLSRLQEHSKLHAVKSSYWCPICCKEFFSMANLRMHKLIRLSNQAYECPECDKGFVRKVDFWRHLQNVHEGRAPKSIEELVLECGVFGAAQPN